MLPKPRSITEEGGLQAHLVASGVDWALFCRLDDSGLSHTAIGKVLGRNRNTIRKWRLRRQEEQGMNDNAA